MKKLLLIPLLLLSLTTMAACSTTDDTPDTPSGNGNMLVLYFSAEGHTQAIAERIVKLTGADIHRIEAAEPYAANPYDDSDRIQHEAYNDLRPGVANLLDKEALAKYDTIFVGSTRRIWRQLSGSGLSRFRSGPIVVAVDVTISSRIASIGGLVTCANICLK